jgi:hypothetical protein
MLKPAQKAKVEVLGPEHFRVLCAWCSAEIRPARVRVHGHAPPPESHGICVPCALQLGMPAELYQNVA